MARATQLAATVTETVINDLLDATQRPFSNRLEAVCYMWFVEDGEAQEVAQRNAIHLAAYLCELIYLDVDRGV